MSSDCVPYKVCNRFGYRLPTILKLLKEISNLKTDDIMDDVKEHCSIIFHCKRALSEPITHLVRAYLVHVLPRSAGGPRLIGPRFT
jgi:hypothetical protein